MNGYFVWNNIPECKTWKICTMGGQFDSVWYRAGFVYDCAGMHIAENAECQHD